MSPDTLDISNSGDAPAVRLRSGGAALVAEGGDAGVLGLTIGDGAGVLGVPMPAPDPRSTARSAIGPQRPPRSRRRRTAPAAPSTRTSTTRPATGRRARPDAWNRDRNHGVECARHRWQVLGQDCADPAGAVERRFASREGCRGPTVRRPLEPVVVLQGRHQLAPARLSARRLPAPHAVLDHLQIVRAFVGVGVGHRALREAPPRLVDRCVLVLLEPPLHAVAQHARCARRRGAATPRSPSRRRRRRGSPSRVGLGVHAARARELTADATREQRDPAQREAEVGRRRQVDRRRDVERVEIEIGLIEAVEAHDRVGARVDEPRREGCRTR